jgi:AcrR family transcriptional regulator
VDQDEKRTTIAKAAYDVIATHGIGKATMRAIAQQAECTTGMVVHYFKDKQDVLLHAHNHAAQDVRSRMREHERNYRGLALLLELLIEVLPTDARRKNNWKIWMSFWDTSVSGGRVSGEQSTRVSEWHRRLRRALSQAVEAGEIDPATNIADEVDLIASLVEGLAIQVIVHRRALGAERQVRLLGDYLRRLSLSPA